MDNSTIPRPSSHHNDLEKGTLQQKPTESQRDAPSKPPSNIDAEDFFSHKDSSSEVVESNGGEIPHLVSGFGRIVRAIQALVPRALTIYPQQPFPLVVRELERCEFGYPYLAAFTDSSEDFMIYRRFGFLHTRLLLQKQNELTEMEKELDYIDTRDKREDVYALQRRMYDERRNLAGETRKQLLGRIEEALLKYDQLLLNSQQLVGANRPTDREHRSVVYFIRHKAPLAEGEANYIWHKDDLMTLRPGRETAWLDSIVTRILRTLPRKAMKKVFCREETKEKTKDPILFLPRKSSIRHLVNGIVLIWILVLFTIPIYALYHVGSTFQDSNANRSKAISMAILFVATLLFAVGLWLFTKAKRHEILASSAAYCALLVVFIANLGMDDKKSSMAHANKTQT